MSKYILLVSRMGAYFIDYLPFYILVYLLGHYGALGYLGCLLALFLYRFLTTAYFGATFGMMALKLHLERHEIQACLKREIFRFASALFYIGYLYAVFDPKGRTLHDIASNTMVKYKNSSEEDEKGSIFAVILAYLLLVISVGRWSVSYILNDIGGIGLKKLYTSEEYFQSFDGDNLISLSQNELFLKTLGRKYTTVVDIGNKPHLIRIANRQKFTEVYRLDIEGKKLIGQYIYKINMPVQYICSGNFRGRMELCGISPKNEIILVDERGITYASGTINIPNMLSLKCGDIDSDGHAEAVILNRIGDVEIFKYINGKLKPIYLGKVGEDIVPEAFYLRNGIDIIAKGSDDVLYNYFFKNGRFAFVSEKHFKDVMVSNVAKLNQNMLVFNIDRTNMTFRKGKIQNFELYKLNGKIKRLYNFGSRPGRPYAYNVKNLEGIYDINGDGKQEIILKSVGRDDVMGQGYKVEVYRLNIYTLWINRALSRLEEILFVKV